MDPELRKENYVLLYDGIITLPDNFTWTPTQLLAMVKEIDQICPEE
jgi:hypothetical protein